jgi:Na+/H+ antiporter NhaC
MTKGFTLIAAGIGATLLPAPLAAQGVDAAPAVIVGGIPFSLTVEGAAQEAAPFRIETVTGRVVAEGVLDPGEARSIAEIVVSSGNELPLTVTVGPDQGEVSTPFVPGWFSVLPPLVAIGLALLFREVIISLFAGVWLGALAVAGFNPLSATWRVVDEFAVPALGDTSGQTQIVVFSLLLGGMVGIISRNGGTRGIVQLVVRWATTPRRGKLATWGAGLAIFFDDYANTLIVGNALRPITDKLKVSREKLAYLVDSTAAPIAAIVPISTWVGYEISLIADGLRIAAEQQGASPELAAALLDASPFTIFLETIPYRFYPLLALFLAFLTSWTNRDFGPMAAAERRAARGGGLTREGAVLAADISEEHMTPPRGTPEHWWNAALPVLTVTLVVLVGLYTTGRASAGPDASVMDVFGEADPFVTLLWGSLAGCIVAVLLSVGQRLLSIQDTIRAWISGMRAMIIAIVILVLAWSLGSVTEILGTAPYLAQILSERLPLGLIPALVFVTAAAISFATGTSWGTMAILVPLVIPLTVGLGGAVGFEGGGEYSILLGAISSVLAGAIFGDHCSPISDTTVMSSMASACDHMDHVRTQLPYALAVAAITIPIGDVGTAYGLPNWVALGVGAALLWALLRWRGTTTLDPAPAA